MNIALVHPETIDFNRLIRVMRQTSYGCLLESFIRVDDGRLGRLSRDRHALS